VVDSELEQLPFFVLSLGLLASRSVNEFLSVCELEFAFALVPPLNGIIGRVVVGSLLGFVSESLLNFGFLGFLVHQVGFALFDPVLDRGLDHVDLLLSGHREHLFFFLFFVILAFWLSVVSVGCFEAILVVLGSSVISGFFVFLVFGGGRVILEFRALDGLLLEGVEWHADLALRGVVEVEFGGNAVRTAGGTEEEVLDFVYFDDLLVLVFRCLDLVGLLALDVGCAHELLLGAVPVACVGQTHLDAFPCAAQPHFLVAHGFADELFGGECPTQSALVRVGQVLLGYFLLGRVQLGLEFLGLGFGVVLLAEVHVELFSEFVICRLDLLLLVFQVRLYSSVFVQWGFRLGLVHDVEWLFGEAEILVAVSSHDDAELLEVLDGFVSAGFVCLLLEFVSLLLVGVEFLDAVVLTHANVSEFVAELVALDVLASEVAVLSSVAGVTRFDVGFEFRERSFLFSVLRGGVCFPGVVVCNESHDLSLDETPGVSTFVFVHFGSGDARH